MGGGGKRRLGLELRLGGLEQSQLLSQHDVALNFDLSLHERLLRVQLARHQRDEILILQAIARQQCESNESAHRQGQVAAACGVCACAYLDGNGAVRFGCFVCIGERATSILEVEQPRSLVCSAGDVELEGRLHLRHELRRLLLLQRGEHGLGSEALGQ